MVSRNIPVFLRHAPAPTISGFASLAAIESITRGLVISVFPLAIYQTLADKKLVSEVYFFAGLLGLFAGLLVPALSRFIPRRFLYLGAMGLYVISGAITFTPLESKFIFALFLQIVATATAFVCFNGYLLDYVDKISLGRAETQRLFFSAIGWTFGPVIGVYLFKTSENLPFLLTMICGISQAVLFLYMRLGSGKLIVRAKAPTANPFGYLKRFFEQPRLVAGWAFAVIRSCGWWIYVVYMPIYAIEKGLGSTVGGTFLSLTNASLFAVPLMLKFMEKTSVRYSVRLGFLVAGACFIASAILAPLPWATIMFLFLGSIFLIFLDMSAGLPFLLAVKPSERTEMSAVYSSYRDVSGIATPGVSWFVLLVFPSAMVFAVMGFAHLSAYILARSLPSKLGQKKKRRTIHD